MSTVFLPNSDCEFSIDDPVWNPPSYRCHLAITREDDSVISVIVLNLPGIGSCGDSEEEAVENVREAIQGAIEGYKANSADIPWRDDTNYSIPDGAKQKWILVDA